MRTVGKRETKVDFSSSHEPYPKEKEAVISAAPCPDENDTSSSPRPCYFWSNS